MVTSHKELGTEKDYAGEGQQHIQNTDLSSERAPHRNKAVTVKE
jgi:hypothetical protein